MIKDWLKKDRILVIFISVLILGLALSWITYALFGHQLIKAIYQGSSLEVLNRIIERQTPHPLEFYFELGDWLFLRLNVIAFSFIFLFSIWSGKNIPKKWFLCLIIILSLCQISSFINFKNLDSLLIHDDHPKHYSITIENANLLLKHGTPFGFNHNFQGGIPTFYLRGCFLELIPFSFFLGEQLGYQVMLIFFIVLIPLSLFFLVLELTKNEDIAKLVSFISTFQLQLYPCLYYGMTAAVVAMPLSFLSLLFFLRYLYNKKCSLFALSLFSGLLAYTNLAIFAITWLFFTIVFVYKLITQKQFIPDLKKLFFFVLLNFLICLPFYYNLFNYTSFLKIESLSRTDWKAKTWFDYICLIFLNLKSTMSPGNILFFSILFLLLFYHNVSEPKNRLILRNALIFSLIILYFISFEGIPKIEIFIRKINWLFRPYIAVFNLALFVLLKINKTARIFGIIILLFIILNQYSSYNRYLKTVKAISEIDNEINAFISPEDFVLFENYAHFNPARPDLEPARPEKRYDRGEYSHWLTYLQKDLGVKFFSHIGDDPHPFNNLRHMYITNGFFKGEPLSEDNEKEFIGLLKDWGVNKVCVWSPIAEQFFDKSSYFKLLGKSKKYTCYIATYQILPQVRLNKAGAGRIIDETPFSFTVYLENISEKQTVTINKNYFNFWSAYNEKGDKVPLRECNQKLCFDTADNGYIFFRYQKNILLNLTSLLVLFFTLVSDLSRYGHLFK